MAGKGSENSVLRDWLDKDDIAQRKGLQSRVRSGSLEWESTGANHAESFSRLGSDGEEASLGQFAFFLLNRCDQGLKKRASVLPSLYPKCFGTFVPTIICLKVKKKTLLNISTDLLVASEYVVWFPCTCVLPQISPVNFSFNCTAHRKPLDRI